MFAVQLTETPVAAGAKGPRASEGPLALAGPAKADFQTFLGQAQTGRTQPAAAATPMAVSDVADASGAPVLLQKIERLPRTVSGAPAFDTAATLADPLPAEPEMIGKAGPAPREPVAVPDPALPMAEDSPKTSVPDTAADLPLAQDMEHIPTASVSDQEAVPARTLSPDTETGSEAETPDLSPSDIPDNGLPQPASGIPSGPVAQNVAEASGDTAVVAPKQVSPIAGAAEDMIATVGAETDTAEPLLDTDLAALDVDLPEIGSDPMTPDLSLETDLSAPDMGLPLMAGAAQIAADRHPETMSDQTAAPSLTAELRGQVEPQPRLQTPEQPAGDAVFSRVLTDVSVAAAAVAPAQPTQQGSAPAQVQIQTPLDMSQPDWAEKLVEEVSLQPMGRGDTLTLTLTPERLGPMQVRLEMQDGQTHVHFITETPEAARLLTEAQSRLADLMSRAGVDLGSHSASTGQGSQQNDRSAQGAPLQNGMSAPQQDSATDQREAPARPAGSGSRSTIDVVA